MQRLLQLALLDLCDEVRHRSEEHMHSLHAGLDGERRCHMRLSRPRIAVEHDVAPLPDEVKRFEPGQYGPDAFRQLVAVQLVEILQLRESCGLDALLLPSCEPALVFGTEHLVECLLQRPSLLACHLLRVSRLCGKAWCTVMWLL